MIRQQNTKHKTDNSAQVLNYTLPRSDGPSGLPNSPTETLIDSQNEKDRDRERERVKDRGGETS